MAKYRIRIEVESDDGCQWEPVELGDIPGHYFDNYASIDAIDPGCALQQLARELHADLEDDGTGR